MEKDETVAILECACGDFACGICPFDNENCFVDKHSVEEDFNRLH